MKTFSAFQKEKTDHIAYAQGSIGIARVNMPQIASADVPEFLEWIQGKGYKVHQQKVLPSKLVPTQMDINMQKVAALKDKPDQLKKILIVSKTYQILDGHHRYFALLEYYPKTPITVEVVECDIITLINLAKEFPKAFHKAIHEAISQASLEAHGKVASMIGDSIRSVTEIGWWFGDTVRLYHGTHADHLPSIVEHGLVPHAQGTAAGFVSMALDPKTAYAWAGFSGAGGESVFRAGSEVAITPPEDRRIIEVSLPQSFVSDLLQPAVSDTAILNYKLQDKAVYEAEKAAGVSDLDYYALTEVRLPQVPAKYITRILTK